MLNCLEPTIGAIGITRGTCRRTGIRHSPELVNQSVCYGSYRLGLSLAVQTLQHFSRTHVVFAMIRFSRAVPFLFVGLAIALAGPLCLEVTADPWDDFAGAWGSGYIDSLGQSLGETNDVWVNGYWRSNGTYVQGHYRSSPDGVFENNWTTKGNRNPYTGAWGTRTTPPERNGPSRDGRMTLYQYYKLRQLMSHRPSVPPSRLNRDSLSPKEITNPYFNE